MVTLNEFSPIVPSFDTRFLVMAVHGAVRDNELGIPDVDIQFVTCDLHINFRCIKPQQQL